MIRPRVNTFRNVTVSLTLLAVCPLVAPGPVQAGDEQPGFRLAALMNRINAEILPQPGAEIVPVPDPALRGPMATPQLHPSPALPAGKVVQLPVTYRTPHHVKRKLKCVPTTTTVLLVEDPCNCGCYVEVPVCVPACCQGPPEVCGKQGVLGRRSVTYDWANGVRVKVLFRARGDLVVVTTV
jgi:hypothetical protein